MKGESIYPLLDRIRTRHPFYLSSKSLTALWDFLSGYSCADITTEIERPPFGLFNPWAIYRHFKGSGGAHVIQHILGTTPNEAAAFDKYFELLDEYRRRRPQFVLEARLSAAQRERFRRKEMQKAFHFPHPPKMLRLRKCKGEKFWFLTVHGCSGADELSWLETVLETQKGSLTLKGDSTRATVSSESCPYPQTRNGRRLSVRHGEASRWRDDQLLIGVVDRRHLL